MKIREHLVQLLDQSESDVTILTTPVFPVNLRLYRGNENYRNIILDIIRYMDEHLRTTFEDYKQPKGVAAPNLGFPFRIIGYRKNGDENQFFINPKIIYSSGIKQVSQTNCGSVCLDTPIEVERYTTIDIEYYDLNAVRHELRNIFKSTGGFTIQNSIDQLDGKNIMVSHKKVSTPCFSG